MNNLDLRLPLGLLFTFIGLLLSVYGLATDGSLIYQKSLGLNVNLDWGMVLLVFGLFLFAFGRRGQMRLLRASGQLPPATPRKIKRK